ncbi:MAG: DNA adenine methylase [Acidaminococcaceae bacterium]
MQYISAKATARKWEISQRRVAVLCAEKRIVGATKVGNMWLIPSKAMKPIDARSSQYMEKSKQKLKPFVKWAGGKGQLLTEIRKVYPAQLGKTITKYAEPFVGGGAVLFDVLSNYELDSLYISDINAELINTYKIIRDDIDKLIERLSLIQLEYLAMEIEQRKLYYYDKRFVFNGLKINLDERTNVEKAALFIFLNKTCFNGLYRVNKKGLFNVPMGAYKTPCICDAENLRNISQALKKVIIVCGDYRKSVTFIDQNTFVYFDPPYRPLTETASFTSYTEQIFDDQAQKELAYFVAQMSEQGAKIVASNSDPKNSNAEDDFFDVLYSEHKINRIEATRMINCNGSSRGKISELLIANW